MDINTCKSVDFFCLVEVILFFLFSLSFWLHLVRLYFAWLSLFFSSSASASVSVLFFLYLSSHSYNPSIISIFVCLVPPLDNCRIRLPSLDKSLPLPAALLAPSSPSLSLLGISFCVRLPLQQFVVIWCHLSRAALRDVQLQLQLQLRRCCNLRARSR